ncbi:MAG: SPASM domain-containing protein, partial [Clostridia bacterium]|nr:SPASM domain-containing protein [Clostridia bacterium]
LKEEYELLAKEMLRREETGDGFTFYHYMIDLQHGPCIYKRISGCGSGTEYMAVTPWGDLYPCHQFVGEEEYRLGDIWNGVTEKDKQDEFRYCNAYARPDCADCWAKLYCSGGCAANAYHATGDVKGIYEYGCELFRKRIECAIMIQVAHAEHPDLYKPHRVGGDKAISLNGRLAAVPDEEDCGDCTTCD